MIAQTSARPMLDGFLARLIYALLAVWAAAALAGLANVGAGAAVGGVGLLAVVWWVVQRARSAEIKSIDWGLVGIAVMAATPLVPARLGPTLAGVGWDDLPLILGVIIGGLSVFRAEGLRALFPWPSWPLYVYAVWNGLIVLFDRKIPLRSLPPGLGRWLLVALALATVIAVSRREGKGRVVLAMVLVVGLLEALFGLWAYVVDWTVRSEIRAVLIGLELWNEYRALYDRTPGRICGTLGVSSNFFGGLMLIPSILAAGWFQRSKDRLARPAFAAACVALVFALVLAYTRAGLIAVVVGAVMAIILVRKAWFAALLIFAIALPLFTTPALERFSEKHDRWSLAEQAWDLIWDEPDTGLGPNETQDSQLDPLHPRLVATAHNSFLHAAVETGVAGGVIFLVATVLPAAALLRRRGPPPAVITAVVCAGLFAFGVQAFSNNLFHIPGVAIFYWLALGAGLGLAAPAEE